MLDDLTGQIRQAKSSVAIEYRRDIRSQQERLYGDNNPKCHNKHCRLFNFLDWLRAEDELTSAIGSHGRWMRIIMFCV